MAGADMNTTASLVPDMIQTQQSTLTQGAAASVISGSNSGADFAAYMRADTSYTEDMQSERNIEKNTASVCVKNAQETESVKSDSTVTGEAVENQGKMEENAISLEDSVIKPVKMQTSQKLQELLSKVVCSGKISEDDTENLQEALTEIQEQLMHRIIESFDVTDEEVKEALEVLAITIVDLLQTDNLKDLAVYVSGEESLVSLVTNEDIYSAYKEVSADIEEMSTMLMDKFSITPEELQEIASQMKETTPETAKNQMETVTITAVTEEATDGAEQTEMTVLSGTKEKQPQIIVEVSKTMENSEKQDTDNNQPAMESSKEQIPAIQESAEAQKNEFASTANGEESETEKKGNDNPIVQTDTSYATVVNENEVQTVVKTQKADFDGIVRQIVEQIKVQIKPDVSSMELQLNPENLGKVNLQVTSKGGAVTAQMFVQNETVKTMIESQLSVLREAMNEQGVKVQAVEVTVETGQFGRSLEQHSEQQKQEAEKQAKSYQHRGINLLAGIEEESMDSEEVLRAHLMRESGNSVDMNA